MLYRYTPLDASPVCLGDLSWIGNHLVKKVAGVFTTGSRVFNHSSWLVCTESEQDSLQQLTDSTLKKTGAQDTCMLLGCNKANLLLRWSDRIQSGMTNEKTHLTKHLLKKTCQNINLGQQIVHVERHCLRTFCYPVRSCMPKSEMNPVVKTTFSMHRRSLQPIF